jgi:hypothetical protein
MVCNTHNYWHFGLCPSSCILKLENTMFRKLDLFLSSGEGGDAYSAGSFRKSRCLPLTWGRKQIKFPKRRILVFRVQDDGQRPKPQ